jgi:hypothetical protein
MVIAYSNATLLNPAAKQIIDLFERVLQFFISACNKHSL